MERKEISRREGKEISIIRIMFPAARDEERNTKAQPRKPIILIIPISFNSKHQFLSMSLFLFLSSDVSTL